ncbi:hypothetical protein ACTHQ0_25580 [Priestia megaterium]|uniref:hypothetical protein n=1 Tax=Priestia megaterium TaxID=1404 RepID=UPI003F7F1000
MNKTGVFVIGVIEELLFQGNLSNEFISDKLKHLNLHNYKIEHFDYNNSSFDDLIDYISFKDYDSLVFIISEETQRILSIIEFLKKNITELNNVLVFEDRSINIDINVPDINIIKQNGSRAFLSGIYDSFGIRPYLIKHIDGVKTDEYNLNNSIILNCAINSTIITNEPEKWSVYPLIKIKPENYLQEKYLKIDEDKLSQLIKDFSDQGVISDEYHKVRGIGNKYGLNRLNSISIFNNNIYLDSQQSILLGKATDSFLLLKNQYTVGVQNLNVSKLETDAVKYINLITPINTSSDYKGARFILPVTRYKNPPKPIDDCDKSFIEWIGIEKDQEYFLYNFVKGRLFKVDYNFITKFEIVQKNEDVNNDANDVRLLLEKV